MRTARFAVAAAGIAAFLAAAGAVPASAAASARAGGAITCNRVDASLPNVTGFECDTDQWGPISNFVIVGRGTSTSYQCQTGWAEGGLWVRGSQCKSLATGGTA